MSDYEIKWADIAFGSKKVIRDLNATFIAAPRKISLERFTQLVKSYLSTGNIVVGIADELYIDGFDNQPQFKTLQADDIKSLVDKVNKSASPSKITIFHYRQSDILPIYEKIKFKKVVLINGSWRSTFHNRPEYHALVSHFIPFEFVSPFASEDEAKKYHDDFEKQIISKKTKELLTDIEMIREANEIAKFAFDNSFQTGVVLGKKSGDKYKLLATAFNKTVPYQTFAWHFGPLRERNLSMPGDLNHYDTIHAEMNLLVQAQKSGIDMNDTTLFINLLPCPNCARVLCETDINEIVYRLDHSNGYAVALLEKAGKKVRRLLDTEELIKAKG